MSSLIIVDLYDIIKLSRSTGASYRSDLRYSSNIFSGSPVRICIADAILSRSLVFSP